LILFDKADEWPINHYAHNTNQKQDQAPGYGNFDKFSLAEVSGAVGDNGRGASDDQHDK
jgi:hypothetical protein